MVYNIYETSLYKFLTIFNPCMSHPFIHPSVCGSLSYYKWFVTCTSAIPMLKPMHVPPIHPFFCMWFAQLL